MASVELVWKRSALPINSKTNILLEVMGRRLRNYDPQTPWAQKCEIVSRMDMEMKNCGHRKIFRHMITGRAVGKHRDSLKKDRERRSQSKLDAAGMRNT